MQPQRITGCSGRAVMALMLSWGGWGAGLRAAAPAAPAFLIEVTGGRGEGFGGGVVSHDLSWDPAGQVGLPLARAIEVWEVTAEAAARRVAGDLLLPAEGQAGRATLLFHLMGQTAAGQTRRFAVGDQSRAAVATPRPPGMRVVREDNLLRVGNRWYEVTHDLARGGAIVQVDYRPGGESLRVIMRDAFSGQGLTRDAKPQVHVRGGDGDLGVVVEVSARLLAARQARDQAPRVHYRYRYDAASPFVRVEAVVPEQAAAQRYVRLRLLDFQFRLPEGFEDPLPLITAGSGPRIGAVIPQRTVIPGEARPRAGSLWHGAQAALALIHPSAGTDLAHEWMGERQALAASLYFGPQDRAEAYLAQAAGPIIRARLPKLSARIEAGQAAAAAAAASSSAGALASAFFQAARQRVEQLLEPALAEHLTAEGEAVLREIAANHTLFVGETAYRTTDSFVALANTHTALLFRKFGSTLSLDGLFKGTTGLIQPADYPRPLWSAWFRVNQQDRAPVTDSVSVGDDLVGALDDDLWTIEDPEAVAVQAARIEDTDRIWAAATLSTDETLEIRPDAAGGKRLRLQSTAPIAAQVEIHLPPAEGLSHWRIALKPVDERVGLWELSFPMVSGVQPDRSQAALDYISTPGGLGLAPNPVLGGYEEPYHLGTVYRRGQYRAYYQGTAGFYFGAHDPDLAPLGVVVRNRGVGGGLDFTFLHPVEHMGEPGVGHRTADRLVVGAFAGNWFDAVQLYRDWLTRQDWFPQQPLHENPSVPEWAKQAVVSLRGAGENVVALQTMLGQPPAISWYYHGWEAERTPAELEELPSPKWGTAPDYPVPLDFSTYLSCMQREGIRVGLYAIDRRWSLFTRRWFDEVLATDALTYSQSADRADYRTDGGFASVCPVTAAWRDNQAQLGRDLAALGGDGVYLDLGGGSRSPYTCMATGHDHPPGASGALTAGKRAAIQRLRDGAREVNPEFIVMTEGQTFGYFFTEKDGWIYQPGSMPVSTALYFDYLRPLAGLRPALETNHGATGIPHGALSSAKIFAWGSSLGRFRGGELTTGVWRGGIRTDVQANPVEVAYFRNLVWHKFVGRPWLNLGRMRRPLNIVDVAPAPDPEFFEDTFVPHGVWEAPDGRIALVFANGWHGQALAFRYDFDPGAYGIPTDGSHALYRLTPVGTPPDVEAHWEAVEPIRGAVTRRETLAPGDVLILVAQQAAPLDRNVVRAD